MADHKMLGDKVMDDFISPYEAECLVQTIQEIDIKEYGSK